MSNKLSYIAAVALFLIGIVFLTGQSPSHSSPIPVVAIANYGPHSSLEAAISGFKDEMARRGFIQNETVVYEIADVGFDPSLIPQMLISLKAKNPKVIVVMTTPIAAIAKAKITDIPLVYTVVTDPIEAGLLKNKNMADNNMTGSSEMQDLTAFLSFAQSLLPESKRIGILYATSEANDAALVRMMKESAAEKNMVVVAIPVDQARDVPMRMQEFKNKVDFIYVGTSGPIQPTLPVISAMARKMHIPLFNADSQAVRDGLALGSFGVDYHSVGRNAGKLAAAVLDGESVTTLAPVYPSAADHCGIINKKIAASFDIKIPDGIEIVG